MKNNLFDKACEAFVKLGANDRWAHFFIGFVLSFVLTTLIAIKWPDTAFVSALGVCTMVAIFKEIYDLIQERPLSLLDILATILGALSYGLFLL